MKKALILLGLILVSQTVFAGLKFLVRPGIDFLSDSIGFSGTAGFRYYFYPQLPFMPSGLYIGAQGLFAYAAHTNYSVMEAGPLGDIGYTIMARGRMMTFTINFQAGAEYVTFESAVSNAPPKWAFSGQFGLDYETRLSDAITLGVSIGYRFFTADTSQLNPFVRVLFGWDIF